DPCCGGGLDVCDLRTVFSPRLSTSRPTTTPHSTANPFAPGFLMTPQPKTDILLDMPLDRTRRRAVDFLELTKPRVILMVLVTTAVGFYLGAQGAPDYLVLLHTLIGTALAGGGTLA